MGAVLIYCLLVTGYLPSIINGIDWNILDLNKLEWKDATKQMDKVMTVLKDQAANLKDQAVNFKDGVMESAKAADIRLLRKDRSRLADTHELLKSADIPVSDAKAIFETGWTKFYSWASDLETEYTSVDKADTLLLSDHYNNTLDTILILHDSCGHATDQTVLKTIHALKLRNFDVHYNIMMLDFKEFMCSNLSPSTGILKFGLNPQLEHLATEMGEFIYKGTTKRRIKPGQINMIGFGVSTYLAGLVAKHTFDKTAKKINSILGLDPPVSMKSFVDRGSVKTAHIYHTFKLVPYTEPKTGLATADFVFGGAKRGPQCRTAITTSCFKDFGVQLFVSTLLYPKIFAGRACTDYNRFSYRFCDVNKYVYVSFPPDKSAKGSYHMDISYDFPFGKGLEGINEDTVEEAESGSVDVTKLSRDQYMHHMEVEVTKIRDQVMGCIKNNGLKGMTQSAFMRCIMATQPAVRRMERSHLITRQRCEPYPSSPTGVRCLYHTRTDNAFYLPF